MLTPPRELIENLRPDSSLRCHTGLLLVPAHNLEELPQWGALLGLDIVPYGEFLLGDLPKETRFVNLTAESETRRLRTIADAAPGSPVLLVSQLDIAVSRLRTDERGVFWLNVMTRLTQTRHGLLLAMPEGAHRLLPAETVVEELRRMGRVATVKK